jgi:hypothetical protein
MCVSRWAKRLFSLITARCNSIIDCSTFSMLKASHEAQTMQLRNDDDDILLGLQSMTLAVASGLTECCICLDAALTTIICCSNLQHHMCAACLNKYAAAEAHAGQQRSAASGGRLRCPGDGCACVLELYELAQHLFMQTFESLQRARDLCIEQRTLQAAQHAHQEQAARAAAGAVAKARVHIIDYILTLRCPACSKAFCDFDGCFALRCADEQGHGCGAAFCAFCLRNCARDAHRHVAECTLNISTGRSVWGTLEQFNAAQRARRQLLVQQYLLTLEPQLRANVQAAVAQHLQDLHITLQYEQQQQHHAPAQAHTLLPFTMPDARGFSVGIKVTPVTASDSHRRRRKSVRLPIKSTRRHACTPAAAAAAIASLARHRQR